MWNDGVSKELAGFFEGLQQTGEIAVKAVQEQVDAEAEKLENTLARTAPRKTGGLARSVRKTPKSKGQDWYGYEIEFAGTDPKGVPYQKIANILNAGTSKTQGTRFVTKAVRQLKGMDERIAERFEKSMTEKLDKQ